MMTPTQSHDPPSGPGRRRFPKRHPYLAVFLTLGILMIAFHPSLLRFTYGILVVDQPSQDCRYVMIATPTPECFDAAAEMMAAAKGEQTLLVELAPRRTVLAGAIPPKATFWKQDLAARGVSDDRIRTITTQAATPHQMFRELDAILDGEANAACRVISTSTLSHYYRHLIDDALPDSGATRYHVQAVRPEASDASTWWRSRSGVKRVMNHGLRLAFVVLHGESNVDPEDPYRHLMANQVSR